MGRYEIVIFERKSGKEDHTGVFAALPYKEVINLQIALSTATHAFLLHCVQWDI